MRALRGGVVASRPCPRELPDAYRRLAREVEWKLIEMPLPRLQLIGRQEDRFLYEYSFTKEIKKGVVSRHQRGDPRAFDNRLLLEPGVSGASSR